MLNKNFVNELLFKLGLNDFEYTVKRQDNSGDFIEVFSPELNFALVKNLVLSTKSLYETIDDIGPTIIILTMKDDFNGTNFYYNVKFSSGIAFGTTIMLGTKRIDYYTSEGLFRPFITFEMMSSYVKSFDTANV
jgi:hypothetical protein